MKRQIKILKAIRKNYLKILEGLSLEQLNVIPEGFNNNIIWNVGHVVVTQQLLCYALAGQAPKLPKAIIEAYRKGSKPEKAVSQVEADQIKEWLKDSAEWIEADLAAEIFQNYKTYPTSFGFALSSIQDAVAFNNVHESMHYGYLIALKKHLKI